MEEVMEPINDYYEYLKKAGADVAPDVESFKTTLSDVNTAKQYYGYLRQAKFDTPDTFESFSGTLGLGKKKDGSTDIQTTSPSQSVSTSGLLSGDPITELLKKRKRLKAEFEAAKAESSYSAVDGYIPKYDLPSVQSQLEQTEASIKNAGYDADELEKDLGSFVRPLSDKEVSDIYSLKSDPLQFNRKLSALKWHDATRNALNKNSNLTPEQREQKKMALEENISKGGSLSGDWDEAFSYANNTLSLIYDTTAGDGDERERAIDNFKKDLIPALSNIFLKKKAGEYSGKNIPYEFGLMVNGMFNKYKTEQTAKANQLEFKDPNAIAGRQLSNMEVEQDGIAYLQQGLSDYFSNTQDLKKAKEVVDESSPVLTDLKTKIDTIRSSDPELVTRYEDAIKSFDAENAKLNQIISTPEYQELNKLGGELKTLEEQYKSSKGDKKNSSLAAYNNAISRHNELLQSLNEIGYGDQVKKVEELGATVQELDKSVNTPELKEYIRKYNEIATNVKQYEPQSKTIENLSAWGKYLEDKQKTLFARHPQVAMNKAIEAAQDITGANLNGVERAAFNVGYNIQKAVDMADILFGRMFRTPEEQIERDMSLVGNDEFIRSAYRYNPNGEDLVAKPFVYGQTKEVEDKVQAIMNDDSLSSDEKKDRVRGVMYMGMRDGSVYQATNPRFGKGYNLSLATTLNTIVDVAPDILVSVGVALATEGGGSANLVRSLGPLFTTTYVQGFSSYYTDAIRQGIANPLQYANMHTLIDAGTEILGTRDINSLKKLFANKKGFASEFFRNVSEKQFTELVSNSKRTFGRFLMNAGVNSLQEPGEEVLAQLGGNLLDKKMFGQKVGITEGAADTFVNMYIGQLPFTLLGLPGQYREASIGSKMMYYNIGMNKDKSLAALENDFKSGNITQIEYDERRKVVESLAKAVEETPMSYADGNPMKDEDKIEYAFNRYAINRGSEESKTIPNEAQKEIQTIVTDAENSNNKLFKNATSKSTVQEGRAEDNISQPQGINQGQPEVGKGAGSQGQTTQSQANASDSNISGQGQLAGQELSNIESLTPEQIEVTGDATEFANQMQSAQSSLGRAGMSVSPYAQEDYDQIASEGGKFLRAAGNKILALLKPNGEMVSLVKDATVKTKGAAQAMISKMKDMGGLFMDNYDIYLTPIYEKAGYKVVARVPFNEEYAPDGWNAEDSPLKNKPDVVFMVRNDIAPAQDQTFTDYEEAQNYTKSIVDNAVAQGVAKLPSEASAIDTALGQAIPKATKSLEKAGIKFQVVDGATDTDAAKAARGNQALFLSDDGTIIIDRSKLQNDIEAGLVVWHEASHPVMNIIRNTNKPLYDAVVRGLNNAAKKNKGVAGALNWAQSQEQYDNADTQNDEAIVETIGRINSGLIDVSKLDTGLRQKLIDFVNSIAKFFGIDPILNDTDIAAFKKTVRQVADALKTGRDIAEVVGQENVKEYMNTLNSPEIVAGGQLAPQARPEGKKINVYESKEVSNLPERSMQDIYDQFGGRAVAINSDPTRVGILNLPSGKRIFMYGGPAYPSVKDNVDSNVGFATTQLSKVAGWIKYTAEVFGTDGGVTLVATQAPTSILSNSYALRYVMDAISMLPKGILKSSEFKAEFFGKDLVLLKDAFGEKGYNEFVSKYKKADLSKPEVIDDMIAEMAYKVGDDNNPASFKARGAFVSNLLGGIALKSSVKGVEGDAGYVSKKPNKFIAKQLMDRLGINAEKVMREIGEPSLVDLYMNEGKWGMAVSGFESVEGLPQNVVDAYNELAKDPENKGKWKALDDAAKEYASKFQQGGVKHPLFNAKFPGKNPFILDGAYEVNKMFKPIEMTGPKGGAYTKTAAQMLAGSMYVKGQPTQSEGTFEYGMTQPSGNRIQASVGNRDIINGFYSPIEDRINTFKQPKASVQKWKEIVGVKSDEAVFSGLADWLGGMKPDRQLSKEEVSKFIKDNRIEIKEVELGKVDYRNLPEYKEADQEATAAAEKIQQYQQKWWDSNKDEDYAALQSAKENLNKWSGVKNAIEKRKETNGVTKYENYQIPGGENYKEVLITLPNKTDDTYTIEKRGEQLYVVVDKYDSDVSSYMKTEEEARKFIDYLNSDNRKRGVTKFSSSHFTEPNIITHLRMNTRTDADGKKVLFLEEVQSDWGQKGKREGFVKTREEIQKEYNNADKDYDKITEELEAKYGKNFDLDIVTKEEYSRLLDVSTRRSKLGIKLDSSRIDGVQNAPYVTNTNAWVKLGLKVALKEAVKQGADRIAWTTGDQQNERYDLSKKVDKIEVPFPIDNYRQVSIFMNSRSGGTTIDVVVNNEGKVIEGDDKYLGEPLENIVGKDIAEKIISSEKGKTTTLVGDGLKIGGKGMRAFYGDANTTGIVGNVAKALVKELTGKDGGVVESVLGDNVNLSKSAIIEENRKGLFNIYDRSQSPIPLFKDIETRKEAEDLIKQPVKNKSVQPAIDITPELAHSVQQGMPQFSVGNRSEDDLRAPGTGKERDRAMSSRFGDLDPQTQAKIEDDATTYFQKTNKQTAKAVEEFIDGQNLVDMADYVLSNPDIPEVSKVWMAAEVAKRMNAEIAAAKSAGDQQLVDALTSKQSAIYNEFAKQATSLGQAVQAFIAFKSDPNAVGFFLPKILNQLKKAGAENVTEEQKAEIINMLRDVNSAADGLPKDKAIIKLSHYLAGIAPMKPMDVLQSLWYAKILSGITTQSTNFFANVFNTAFELPAVAARIAAMNNAPLSLAAGIKGFGSGIVKGSIAAADIIKTGVRSKEVDKYFAESPLEYFTWSKWLGKTGKAMDYIPPVNFGAWKYIGRMLAATDALFSTANQEAIANMLAYAEAAGTPGNNNFRKANALLGNTKQNIDNAKAQATAEGFDPKSLQGRRRVIEIVAQGRKGTDEADAIGKRITMNYDPEGWTKPLFDATVALQRNFPIIKMVIPFARIVANLTENGLNYSPLGLVRVATGKRNPFNKSGEKLSTEERADLFNKFTLGMSALIVLAAKTGEDDDDWFEITAGGSNDVQKKYELQKGGWRPYTITMKDGTKINYKDWPIAGILAGIGHIRDAKKYSFDDSTQMGLYATGFFQNFYDKSLLSGLQDFFGIFNVEAGRGKYAPDTKMSDRAKKYAAQQVRSVAVSNLAQQTGKMYSELVTGDPQRDAKTFAEVIYRDLPMFNDGIRPIIDVFGDDVKYNTTERLTPKFSVESDKIIKWLNENKLFVGVPQKKNIIAADGSERPMTDEEYYEYRKLAGKETKNMINEFMEGIKYPDQEIKETMFDAAKETAREIAYVTILEKYGFK